MLWKISCASIVAAGLMMTGCGGTQGSTLKCKSSGKNAFETYQTAGFVAVNKAIIANVTSELTANGEANLGNSFTRAGSGDVAATKDNLTTFEGKLGAFLVYAFGGPSTITYTDGVTYDGKQDMVTAHTGLAITKDQYTYFVTNQVVPALTASGVSSDDVSSCFAPVVNDASFMNSIIGH